jgi:putative transposase
VGVAALQHLVVEADERRCGSRPRVEALDFYRSINALAESFFATLECELLDRHHWSTGGQLEVAIFDFIEAFYNPSRRHSSLGYLSPVTYEKMNRAVPAAS